MSDTYWLVLVRRRLWQVSVGGSPAVTAHERDGVIVARFRKGRFREAVSLMADLLREDYDADVKRAL
jgi:hypothetical protein